MALSLTIGATNQLAFIQHQSMSLKFNTFDLTLVNPSTVPALGDTVTLGDPTWVGSVVSVEKMDTVERGTNKLVHITATNEDEAAASAAPFNLSDVPNGSTTYGYQHLTTRAVLDREGTTTTEGSCTIFQTGIWPAMTFTLTSTNHGYAGTSFTAQDVTVTWPKKDRPIYQIQFGDPIVTMSVWLNSGMSGTITTTKITDESVTTPKLAAGAVTADKITAGSITADKLAAELILASLIKTADSGNRVEVDSAGVRAYSATEDLLVNIPTDGSAVYVNGQIEATELVVTGDAVLQGTANELASGSTTSIGSFQSPPAQAPSLAQGYEQQNFDFESTFPEYLGHGYYDAAGGASGATPCFVQIGSVRSGSNWKYYVYEWDWSTGDLDRTTILTPGLTVAMGVVPASITRIGTSWYTVSQAGSGNLLLDKWTRSSGALTATSFIDGDFTDWDPYSTPISTDGTDIFVPGGAGSNQLRIVRYNTSLAKQATIALTEPTFSGDSLGWPAQYVIASVAGTQRHVIGLQHTTLAGVQTAHNFYAFNMTTGALIADVEWPAVAITGGNIVWYPIVNDGTNFWQQNSHAGRFSKFTNWIWTTASAKYWVAYAWYDSVGTTHETTVSPRASITMKKRAQLTVTTQGLPGSGGADEPDKRRIYMFPNATAPATTSLDLQSTTTSSSKTLVTYDSAGAAPAVANGFSSIASAAILQSAAAEWQLKGDGTATFTNASASGTLTLSGTTDAALASTGHALHIGNDAAQNLAIDGNEIMSRNAGAAASLLLNRDGGDVEIGTNPTTITAAGAITAVSFTGTGGVTANSGAESLVLSGNNYIEIAERGAGTPASPAANTARIYCVDNGSGKTSLRVKFSSGNVVTIGTET